MPGGPTPGDVSNPPSSGDPSRCFGQGVPHPSHRDAPPVLVEPVRGDEEATRHIARRFPRLQPRLDLLRRFDLTGWVLEMEARASVSPA